MFDGARFFNTYSHLSPLHQQPAGDGRCLCRPNVLQPVFKHRSIRRCAACTTLSQAYPIEHGKQNRLVFSYLLVTESAVTFWGKNKLNEIDSRITCHPSSGMMRQVMRDLVLTPPKPPWMFISFTQTPIAATGLRVTTDNAMIQFSGKTLIQTIPVNEIDRDYVLRLHALGIPAKTWRRYLGAAIELRDLKIVRETETEYPGLRQIKWLPPYGSSEMAALLLTAGE